MLKARAKFESRNSDLKYHFVHTSKPMMDRNKVAMHALLAVFAALLSASVATVSSGQSELDSSVAGPSSQQLPSKIMHLNRQLMSRELLKEDDEGVDNSLKKSTVRLP